MKRNKAIKTNAWAAAAFLAICATNGMAANPFAKENNTWISIQGKVEAPKADSFQLNYGDGKITVEMDDWDWYKEGHKLINGDEVTVYGWIDDDLFERDSIEASSVYVKDLNSFFYASGADEESAPQYVTTVTTVDPITTVRGKVTSVSGREFTVNTGKRKLTVDTSGMAYNPLDGEGFQKIKKGDIVSAGGDIQNSFFDSRELAADWVVTLWKDRTRESEGSAKS